MLVSRLGDWKHSDNGTSVTMTDPWGTPVTVSLPGVTTQELLERR